MRYHRQPASPTSCRSASVWLEDAERGGGVVAGLVAGPAFAEGIAGFGLADAADEFGRPGVLEGVENFAPVGEAVVDEAAAPSLRTATLLGDDLLTVGSMRISMPTWSAGAIEEHDGLRAGGDPVLITEWRWLPARLLDASVVTGVWKRLVFGHPARTDGMADRNAYVFCMLGAFHAPASVRWRDPNAALLDGPAWEAVRTSGGDAFPGFEAADSGATTTDAACRRKRCCWSDGRVFAATREVARRRGRAQPIPAD